MTPFVLIPFFLAPFIGSFLGVLIRRIPRDETFVSGRSYCESCHTHLSAFEMVPIFSYLVQKGRCRHCGASIDPLHLKVELAALLIPACAVLSRLIGCQLHGVPYDDAVSDLPVFFADCVLGWGLLVLSWIDLICLRLPDTITLPLLLTGLLESVVLEGWDGVYDRVMGCAAGWILFASVAWGYRRLRKRTGLGGGDVKLLALGGAWVGIAPLPSVVLLSSVLGIMTAATTIFRTGRFSMTLVVPFGPCLAGAIWIARLTLTAE
ncbi:prepilin peptidase [Acetobacter fallax]|nr:A24 family peptidase [Acetobacter fallax]